MREGGRLDRDAMKPNAAKRVLVKLGMNSIWNKLTERQNRTQTKLISDPHELYRFLDTPGVQLVKLLFASVGVSDLVEIYCRGTCATLASY